MKKTLILPALATLIVVSACSRNDATNTSDTTANGTMGEPAAPLDTNMPADNSSMMGSGTMDNGAMGNGMDRGMDNGMSGGNAMGNMSNGM